MKNKRHRKATYPPSLNYAGNLAPVTLAYYNTVRGEKPVKKLGLSKCLLAFVILLTTLCHAQTTDRVIVKSVRYDQKSVTVNVGPAVFNPFSGDYDAGYHGDILGCNNEEPTCYGPHQGDQGVIVDGPHVYDGPNMTIRWIEARVTATYALHEEY